MAQNKVASVSPNILIYAFKYSFGKDSYASEDVAKVIVENVDRIPKVDLYSIYRDFKDARFESEWAEGIWDKVAMAIEKRFGDDLTDDE